MCTHNHSKGDAADAVDDHVSATILRRTAAVLLDVPVAMQSTLWQYDHHRCDGSR